MPEPTITHATFVIERHYPAAPARVFAAFSDPAIKRRWYADAKSMPVDLFEMDFRVGGRDRAYFRFPPGSPFPGAALTYDIHYLDIAPDSRLIYAYAMGVGGRCVSSSLVTFELRASDGGTDLIFTEQGAYLEGSGGPQMREDGWRTLLDRLAAELGR